MGMGQRPKGGSGLMGHEAAVLSSHFGHYDEAPTGALPVISNDRV